MRANVNWAAAVAFYLVFVLGIIVLVVWPAMERESLGQALSGARCAMTGLLLIPLLLLAACATTPRSQPEENWMEYLKTLQCLAQSSVSLEKGSEEERRAIERFQSLLSDFKAPDFSKRIAEVYAEDVFFKDTLKTVCGVEEVRQYLTATAEAIDKGTVDFLDLVSDNGNYYFRWTMTIRFKRFARGQDRRSVGMTHVRFDSAGKVVPHQGFWDSAGGLFEHVPALGWMMRRAKKGL